VVAAAGSVDHDRIVDVLARLELPTGEPAAAPALRPTQTRAGRLAVETRPTEQCSVALAVPAPSIFSDRRFAVGLLSAIIGGGMSSRLFVEVRERRGLTYGIDAGETSYSDSGIWSVEWQSSPDRLLEIVDVVRAILGDVAEHGVTAEELARAKGQLRGQTVLGFESPSARMGRLGTSTLLGEERTLPEMLACYERVSGDELQREAAELFAQVPVIAVVGPRVPHRQLEKLLQHW
jgi:predicted Zn-dependent peptidase